eukprot:2448956-Rhodomonas_salina.3
MRAGPHGTLHQVPHPSGPAHRRPHRCERAGIGCGAGGSAGGGQGRRGEGARGSYDGADRSGEEQAACGGRAGSGLRVCEFRRTHLAHISELLSVLLSKL